MVATGTALPGPAEGPPTNQDTRPAAIHRTPTVRLEGERSPPCSSIQSENVALIPMRLGAHVEGEQADGEKGQRHEAARRAWRAARRARSRSRGRRRSLRS